MDHLSSATWFSETVMDDAGFVNEWMGTLDDFVHFCSSNPLFPPASTINRFDQTQNSDDVIQKPMVKTVQHKLSTSSSSKSIISFANSGTPSAIISKPNGGFENPKAPVLKMKTEMDHSEPLGNTIISFSSSQDDADHDNDEHRGSLVQTIEFGAGKRGFTRSLLQAQDHVLAERKRRQKITQCFIALSALIPGLKKLDKASVLGDAIKYIKELQERVRTLEVDQEQTKRPRNKESTVAVKRALVSGHDDDASSLSDDDNSEAGTIVALPEIEVRASGENLLITVYCNKLHNNGVLTKEIFSEIERLHLTINTSHVMPFGSTTYITITAQMDQEFSMEAKDVADNIRITIEKLTCHAELCSHFV